MLKKNIILIAVVCILVSGRANSQMDTYSLNVGILGGYTTPGHIPFWLRSNQFGSIPLNGVSLSFIGSVQRDYDLSKDKLFDWGASFEGRANLGQGSNLTLIEGYGKIRLSIFELRAGRFRGITGLCDTTLTSGSWSISGTNLGIPQIEISIPDFFTLPWFGELLSIKGSFSHGWFGDVPLRRWFDDGDTVQVNTYLHHKSFYGRLGKPSWRLKLYGGFNHQVMWGNENDFYTHDFELSPFSTYLYVMSGKRYNNGFIESTRLGNHQGSIDFGIEYEFKNISLLIYRQNFYEGGALAYLANIQDGLNGVSLTHKKRDQRLFTWDKILFEFLYTKNQAGESWSPDYGSPFEDYYNHGEYIEGWSYNGIGLGTPFINTINEVREGLPSGPVEYFINNRLLAFHFGYEGSVKRYNYILKASWSQNFGTFWTTDDEQSTDIPNPGTYGLFGKQDQLSTYLEIHRQLNKGLNLGFIGAFDLGELYYNSFGIFLKASKTFKY